LIRWLLIRSENRRDSTHARETVRLLQALLAVGEWELIPEADYRAPSSQTLRPRRIYGDKRLQWARYADFGEAL
jgi:hypothetical protein